MFIKVDCKKSKKYSSNSNITDDLSKREKRECKEKYKNLRKTKILKQLPLEEWSKEELLDLIEMYSIYVFMVAGFNKYNIESLSHYIHKGSYEEDSLFEELRKDN